jgi:hypothetical protein
MYVCIKYLWVLTAESVVEQGDVLLVVARLVPQFALVVVGAAVGAARGQELGRAGRTLAVRQAVTLLHALCSVRTHVTTARTRRT